MLEEAHDLAGRLRTRVQVGFEGLCPHLLGRRKELGAVLYTEHVYAFELASFLLLLAIVAAIVLTMRKRPGLKVQDISSQVRVRREDRVRLVSMEAEKD